MTTTAVDEIPLSEAAVELGLTHETLTRQARDGKLRARKVGPIWLTSRSAIDEYRANHKGRFGPRPGSKRN